MNNTWTRGIKNAFSTDLNLECNEVYGVGSGYELEGATPNAGLWGNTMENCTDGILFNSNTLTNDLGYQDVPADNIWEGSIVNHMNSVNGTDNDEYSLSLRSPQGSKYYPNPFINDATASFPIDLLTVNFSSSLDYCGRSISKSVKQDTSFMLEKAIAQNNITYNYNPIENRWFALYYLFERLSTDNNLRLSDDIFQNIYDSLAQTNIKKIYEYVHKLNYSEVDIKKALKDMQLMIPENQIEQNYKDQYLIYLQTFYQGTDTLTFKQKNRLINIAEQCPYIGGRAVYDARVLLSIHDKRLKYRHTCESSDLKKNIYTDQNSSQTINENDIDIQISPNPANTYITIKADIEIDEYTFELYNSLGELLISEPLMGNKRSVLVDGFKSGMYVFFVKKKKNIIKIDKLIIVK